MAGILLQNLSHSTQRRLYTNLAKSTQIWGDPASSQPYLVRFSQIRPFPADFNDFCADLGDFDADLLSFYIFQRWFCKFWRWFCNSDDDPKLIEHTRSSPKPKTDSTDWRRRSVSGHSSFHPTPAGRVRARSKIDRARLVNTPNHRFQMTLISWIGNWMTQNLHQIKFRFRLTIIWKSLFIIK